LAVFKVLKEHEGEQLKIGDFEPGQDVIDIVLAASLVTGAFSFLLAQVLLKRICCGPTSSKCFFVLFDLCLVATAVLPLFSHWAKFAKVACERMEEALGHDESSVKWAFGACIVQLDLPDGSSHYGWFGISPIGPALCLAAVFFLTVVACLQKKNKFSAKVWAAAEALME
jgi:hypothetical protein